MSFYRVTVEGKGIYEAVDEHCPKDDPRRATKPDGSWLNKVGHKYPGAISFWTEEGYRKYCESGLAAWHASVVEGEVETEEFEEPLKNILYKDEYQLIGN